MNSKRYFIGVTAGTLLLLIILALPTILVDPYFHYGEPKGTYELNNQRYQNDGIAKHFTYDALITGSSMVENFKTSEFDQLFGTNAIKLPYSGAHFLEIDNAVNTALKANDDLKIVFRSLDLNILDEEKDSVRYEAYPEYLYDDILVNDVSYFLNKEVLLEATKERMEWQQENKESTTFDEYCAWEPGTTLKEKLGGGYNTERDTATEIKVFTEEDRIRVKDNIYQNVVRTAENNPDVTFYLMLPPYSCLFFEEMIRAGEWEYHIEVQRCAIEELLTCENIKLYSFCDCYDITCNLDNYRDITHYDENISSWLLERIKAEDGLLAKDNYMDYLENIETHYLEMNIADCF